MPIIQCCKTAKNALDLTITKDNIKLSNNMEKKESNRSKSNFYTKRRINFIQKKTNNERSITKFETK